MVPRRGLIIARTRKTPARLTSHLPRSKQLTNLIIVLALVALLVACGPEEVKLPPPHYISSNGLRYHFLGEHWSIEDIEAEEAGFRAAVVALGRSSIADLRWAMSQCEIIVHAGAVWNPTDGRRVGGYQYGPALHAEWQPCPGLSWVGHELGHWFQIALWGWKKPDYDHKDVELWDIVNKPYAVTDACRDRRDREKEMQA